MSILTLICVRDISTHVHVGRHTVLRGQYGLAVVPPNFIAWYWFENLRTNDNV